MRSVLPWRAALAGIFAAIVLLGARAETPVGAPLRMFGGLGACNPVQAAQPSPWIMEPASACNEDAVVAALLPALKDSRKGARVYFRAACQPSSAFAVPFPKTDVHSSPADLTGVDALREMFRGDPGVQVTEGRGVIKVRIGDVADALLQTPISDLALSRNDRYDPRNAVLAILQNADVEAAINKLGLAEPPAFVSFASADIPANNPPLDIPHLPYSMTNMTLDEALDAVAAKFKVIILFGAESCTDGRLFDLNVVYPPDNRTPNVKNAPE